MPDVPVEHTATGVPRGRPSPLSGSSPAHAPSGPPRDHQWTPQRLPVVGGSSGSDRRQPAAPELVKHLAVALSRHVAISAGRVASCRPRWTSSPRSWRSRQNAPHATPLDGEGDAGHSPGVADRLLVTKGRPPGDSVSRSGPSSASSRPAGCPSSTSNARHASASPTSRRSSTTCPRSRRPSATRTRRGRKKRAAELARQVMAPGPQQSNTTAGGCGDSSPHRREVF